MEIVVGDHTIASKRSLKHLGVMIDVRIILNGHVDFVCEKSAKAMSAIARIMPNVGGPNSSTRRLLASVSSSILRYGIPAWGNALENKRNRRRLQSRAPTERSRRRQYALSPGWSLSAST
ncbi:uncharacterized protein LOC134206160 [Armigeres subalbatus]|uniref:uncharacterized protein LOC134206160 n=1 Tax=Armigeres subalbatus TaxID=124917 RepID=UPI002ED524F8